MCYLILENFTPDQQTVSDYLFLNFEETFGEIISLSTTFIKDGKNIEIYPTAEKLGKQFTYADKK